MPHPKYRLIPPDQVRPGDVYKFSPVVGPSVYADVLAVRPRQNLIRTRAWYGGPPTWTYIRPRVGRVTFARKEEVSCKSS